MTDKAEPIVRSPKRAEAWARKAYHKAQALTPGGGAPAPGTPAYDPTWYAATDVYLKPVTGSDAAVGTSAATALKTMAEVVRRYGSSSPQLVTGQSLTIHQLEPMPLGVDVFDFNPFLSGAANFLWIATPTLVGAVFSPTTVTAKVATAAGNDLSMTGALPAGIGDGQIIHNNTRGSTAMVKKVLAGVATLSQPFADAGLSTPTPYPTMAEDNGWVNTDSYQLAAPLRCNWQNLRPVGGDTSNAFGGTTGVVLIEGVKFDDVTGTPGNSILEVVPSAIAMMFSSCAFEPLLCTDGTDNFSLNVLGCWMNGGLCPIYTATVGGAIPGGALYLQYGNVVDGDCIVDAAAYMVGSSNILGSVHFTGNVNSYRGSGAVCQDLGTGGGALMWGAGTMNVGAAAGDLNCYLGNKSGGLWANCFKMAGNHTLNGVAFGTPYTTGAAANPFGAAVAITSANLDTGGGAGDPGLQNPRTGCRYASS